MRAIIVVLCLLTAAPVSAQIALVANAASGSSDTGTTNSTATDTTGADFFVSFDVTSSGQASVRTDSEGNTWTCLAPLDNGQVRGRLCYVLNPITSATHVFSLGSDSAFPCQSVLAFSGVASFDQDSGNTTSGSTTLTPGSITPSDDDALVVSGFSTGSGAYVSIDGGFTVPMDGEVDFADGLHWSCGMAYLIQTAAAAANPTVESDQTSIIHALASFLEGAAVTGSSCRGGLLGGRVGC